MVTLQALDPIRVDFPSPSRLWHVAQGRRSRSGVDAFPGKVFKGEIGSFDARVAQETRTLLVRGNLPNASASCCRACSPTWPCSWASRANS